MGACASNQTPEEKAAAVANKKIEAEAKKNFSEEQKKIKLLLLGAGESGKSTIFKQMKIIYGDETSKEEREVMRTIIWGNIASNLKMVIENSDLFTPMAEENKASGEILRGMEDAAIMEMTPDLAAAIRTVWGDSGIQETWKHRSQYQVQDATEKYCGDLDRILEPDYLPTDADILLARVRTSGIVEETYTIDKVKFVMYDVGGQRNERKKWIHCFDGVTAVIFVAAMNEYDQVLYEDNSTNRIQEALILFDDICNSKWFRETSMILFLNKRDLFEEKLHKVALRNDERFIDFQGPFFVPGETPEEEFTECYDASCKYLLNLFTSKNRQKEKKVYTNITCATDTDNVKVVFSSCRDIILRDNLTRGGFISA